MGVKIRINRGKIYLDVYSKGDRKWENTGLTTCSNPLQNKEVMRIAEILRSKRETQLVTGENDLLDPVKSHNTLYAYMDNCSKHSPQSIPQWTLHYLGEFPGGKHIKLCEVSKTWVKKFKHYLLEETGLHQNTARNYFKALKQILNQAVRENILPRNPASGEDNIKFREPDRVFLNWDEIEMFAKVPTKNEIETTTKKAFLFSCLTGIRLSDIKTLRWENLEHSSSGNLLVKRQEKTKSKIYNQIPNSAWEIANDNQPHTPSKPVFPHLNQLAGSGSTTLARLAKQAGITKKVSWHVARRSFAIKMLENGTDLFTLSKLLGHTKIATTIVYLKMTNTLGQKAVGTMPEITLSGSESHQPDPSTPLKITGDHAERKPQGPPS
jgi:site-specific recombinase XerD